MLLFSVRQGNWHGDIAIKFLNSESVDDPDTLEALKEMVATFRKTRHENLILFMGACMTPPNLAIVTSLCKGKRNCEVVNRIEIYIMYKQLLNPFYLITLSIFGLR